MSRIFVTGSAQGLGLMAAELLLEQGHQVVVHARTPARAEELHRVLPGAETVVVADLSRRDEVERLAGELNGLGTFDAVIHNAAMGYKESQRGDTAEGFPPVFAVNTVAPYLLTAWMDRPKRLVYLSSELQRDGDATLGDLLWKTRRWNGHNAYSDTKLHDTLLAFAVARRWPGTLSNSVHPGWVATRMGGKNASGDLDQGHRTQAWLAVSDEPAALVTGKHWFHMRVARSNKAADDPALQDRLLNELETLTGVALPAACLTDPGWFSLILKLGLIEPACPSTLSRIS